MSANSFRLTRRGLLGAAFAVAVSPAAARAQEGRDPASQELTDARIRMTFNGMPMTATLYDNSSAHDFASMLPLELTIDDYGRNEKIVHLPRKLTRLAPLSPQRQTHRRHRQKQRRTKAGFRCGDPRRRRKDRSERQVEEIEAL